MPSARPDTTQKPALPRPAAKWRALSSPAGWAGGCRPRRRCVAAAARAFRRDKASAADPRPAAAGRDSRRRRSAAPSGGRPRPARLACVESAARARRPAWPRDPLPSHAGEQMQPVAQVVGAHPWVLTATGLGEAPRLRLGEAVAGADRFPGPTGSARRRPGRRPGRRRARRGARPGAGPLPCARSSGRAPRGRLARAPAHGHAQGRRASPVQRHDLVLAGADRVAIDRHDAAVDGLAGRVRDIAGVAARRDRARRSPVCTSWRVSAIVSVVGTSSLVPALLPGRVTSAVPT
ncbi:hypothetical protein Ddc_22444 [Ditylenchus destructor]|nr:hypothetical protein Ddc_22444 [Ditylenchus destructor]